MLTDFIPILSVIIGGLLTVLGGLLTNYAAQSTSRKAEKRKVYREQLERIYEFSNQVIEWVKWHRIRDNINKDAPPCPIDEVVMIARLYLPSLKELALDFKSTLDDSWDEIMALFNEEKEFIIPDPFSAVEKKYEKLLAAIEDLAHKEVG